MSQESFNNYKEIILNKRVHKQIRIYTIKKIRNIELLLEICQTLPNSHDDSDVQEALKNHLAALKAK